MFKTRKILAIFLCLTVVVELNLTALGVQNDESINDFVTTTEPDNNQYNITSPVKSSVTSAEPKNAATSGTCGDNLTWKYNTSTYTLTISGTGVMSSYYPSYDNVTTAPWWEYYNKMKTLVINSGVTSIGYYVFYNCTGLTSVTIPDSVTSIGEGAFYGCTGLTSITIGNGVRSIGSEAFDGCTSLKKVYYTGTVADWCNISFGSSYANPLNNAENLYINDKLVTDLVIPDNVKEIKNYAFYRCTGLTSVTIGNSVKSIGEYTFYNCKSLKSITIPDSVTSIGEGAFEYCTGLKKLKYTGTIADWCNISFGDYSANPLYYAHNLYINDKLVTDLVIPDTVKKINNCAFEYCTSLTNVTIGNSVTSIDSYAFSGCTSLKKVNYTGTIADWCNISFTNASANPLYYAHNLYINDKLVTDLVIPDTVKKINNCAFEYCTSLTNVTIGNSVTSIGGYAFYNCTSLKTVYFCGTQSDWSNISIDSNNAPLKNSQIIFIKYCGDNVFYSIDGVLLYIIGNGEMENYKTAASVPWYEYRDEITEIIIESGVTKVGTYAFYCLDNLKTVKSENKDLQLSKYSLNADNKNITVYSTGGGALQEYCDQNGINFVKPTPATPSVPVLSAVNGTSITVIEEPGTEYSLDKTNWQDSGAFTGLTSLTQYSVYARIKETKEYNASGISKTLTVKTTKLNNDNIPPIPTLKSITSSSISVNTETGIEYSINGTSWNTTGIFSGLKSGTEYSVFARYIETATHFASMPSEPLTVKTDKATVSAPAAPDYKSNTEDSITLKPNALYEYSIDGENWQKSNVFTNLSKNTIYWFYQRVAETDTEYASSSSPALITAIPDRPEILSASYDEITVKGINGFEYCLDDFVWQSDIKFDMLIDNMEYYVYQRIAKIDGEKVYQITSDYTAVTTDNSIIHIHTFDDWNTTAAPTCTEKGEEERVCSVCEYKETRDIEALGHDWSEEWSNDGTNHWHKCNRCEKITDNAEHIYGEWIETKPAKVNEKGERKHICDICGYEEYEEFELGYIVGDTNGDEVITDQDAIYLLFSYYFPDKYPVEQPCDFNNDGFVTDQDAIYLLFHYYFPDKYPIE